MVSDKQLIEDLQDFADEVGRTPTKRDMRADGPHAANTYSRHFGSWNKSLRAAGLRVNVGVTDEELLSDLRDFKESIGHVPKYEEMKKCGPWDAALYENRFGTWNKTLNLANFEINKDWNNASKEGLLSELQRLSDVLDKTPTQKEMRSVGKYSPDVYSEYFGSWNKALKAAGFDVNYERNLSKEKLINDLKQFKKSIGRVPTRSEMDINGPRAANTYRRKFGCWNNALQEAGFEINRKSVEQLSGTGEDYYGKNWYTQRGATVERDGGACRVCGDGEFVHVHHIKPRRRFDDVSNSNTLDNLITLCPSCHGRFEGRWQDANPDEFEEKAKELYSQHP